MSDKQKKRTQLPSNDGSLFSFLLSSLYLSLFTTLPLKSLVVSVCYPHKLALLHFESFYNLPNQLFPQSMNLLWLFVTKVLFLGVRQPALLFWHLLSFLMYCEKRRWGECKFTLLHCDRQSVSFFALQLWPGRANILCSVGGQQSLQWGHYFACHA